MPRRYPARSRAGERSPPTASSPSGRPARVAERPQGPVRGETPSRAVTPELLVASTSRRAPLVEATQSQSCHPRSGARPRGARAGVLAPRPRPGCWWWPARHGGGPGARSSRWPLPGEEPRPLRDPQAGGPDRGPADALLRDPPPAVLPRQPARAAHRDAAPRALPPEPRVRRNAGPVRRHARLGRKFSRVFRPLVRRYLRQCPPRCSPPSRTMARCASSPGSSVHRPPREGTLPPRLHRGAALHGHRPDAHPREAPDAAPADGGRG
jgi:hypothetical protein